MEYVAEVEVERLPIEGEYRPEEVSLHSKYELYAHRYVEEVESFGVMIPAERIAYYVHESSPHSEYVAHFGPMKLPAVASAFEELAVVALAHYVSEKPSLIA